MLSRSARAVGGCLVLVLACARHPVSASGNQPALRDAVLSGIRRPAPRQFAEPEAVVRFVLQQVAARDFSEVTRAFPILESYERITPEVYAKMSTTLPEKIAPQEKITPLDDGAYDRLITIVNRSLNEYREVGNKLLADELAAYGAGDREKRIAETLRLYDGARLKGLQVVSIKANAQAMALNPFDEAMGVTEKKLLEVTVRLGTRETNPLFAVGKIGDNWRVLFIHA